MVIHGIGEQRPMETVRGFVQAIVRPGKGHRTTFWNKPDRMSESFELRCLTAPRDAWRPRTDFFEYYWAYNMRDTQGRHVNAWLLRLLVRWPWTVPRRLRWVWALTWVLAIATGLVVALAVFTYGASPGELPTRLFGPLGGIAAVTALNWIWSLGAIRYLGDAARYLEAAPDNISQRQAIKRDGASLVRRLHSEGHYDRIILVGHSLGSVIAYDILRHTWDEYRAGHAPVDRPSQDALAQTERDGATLEQVARAAAAALTPVDPASPIADRCAALRATFRTSQVRLWVEQRRLGNPWLVTDLVTIGSPLAHAEYLLADSPGDLTRRQMERELPTCPPLAQEGSGHDRRLRPYSYRIRYENTAGEERTMSVLLESAPFAVTRWTNVYFPGDVIGGPVGTVFGAGVVDRPVPLKGPWYSRLLGHTVFAHTHYWSLDRGSQPTATSRDAVRLIRGALDLDNLRLVEDACAASESCRANVPEGARSAPRRMEAMTVPCPKRPR